VSWLAASRSRPGSCYPVVPNSMMRKTSGGIEKCGLESCTSADVALSRHLLSLLLIVLALSLGYFTPEGVRRIVMSMSVYLSSHITRKLHGRTSPSFSILPMAVAQSSDTLCTSGFADDAMFSHSGRMARYVTIE